MSAVTDSGGEILARDAKPGISNLLQIHSSLSGRAVADLEASFAGKGYGELKKEVVDQVIAALEPVQSSYNELIQDKAYLEAVLKAGAETAQKRAYKMLSKAYRKAGFIERLR